MKFQNVLALPALLLLVLALAGCSGEIEVVDAGAYEGTVSKVVPEEREIYVMLEDGQKLELYFNDQTELVHNGEAAEFSALEVGSRVRVTVTRVGNRNEPARVEILGPQG